MRLSLLGLVVIAGCALTSHIRDKVAAVLPNGAEVEISQTCNSIFPHAAAFMVATSIDEAAILAHSSDGVWARASSLGAFARIVTDFRGVGLGATILDAKACLNAFSDRAQAILFEDMPGLYYRSADRKIIVVLFDEPKGEGVVFLQGR